MNPSINTVVSASNKLSNQWILNLIDGRIRYSIHLPINQLINSLHSIVVSLLFSIDICYLCLIIVITYEWGSTGSAVLTREHLGGSFSIWTPAAPGRQSPWGTWRSACNPWSGRTGWRPSSASATASATASAPAPSPRPAGRPAPSAPPQGLGPGPPVWSSPESCSGPPWSPLQRAPRPPIWSPQRPSPGGQHPLGLSLGDGTPEEHPPQTPEGCRWYLIGSFCVILGGNNTEDKKMLSHMPHIVFCGRSTGLMKSKKSLWHRLYPGYSRQTWGTS